MQTKKSVEVERELVCIFRYQSGYCAENKMVIVFKLRLFLIEKESFQISLNIRLIQNYFNNSFAN